MYFPPLLFVTVGINVAASFILVPAYGIMGATWATLIAYFVRICLTLVVSQKTFYIPYDYKRLLKLLVAFSIVLGLVFVLPQWPTVYAIPLKLCILALYPLLLYVLGFFERREIETFASEWITIRSNLASKLKISKSAS